MTLNQKKLVESYIRKEVRKRLKELRLTEEVDMKVVAIAIEKVIDEIDSNTSGVVSDDTEIPKAIIAYLKRKYSIR